MLINDEMFQHVFKYLELSEGKLSKDPVTNGTIEGRPSNSIGFSSRIVSVAKQCKSNQFGISAEDEALVRQWLEYAVCFANYMDSASVARQVLKELNAVLSTRSFFVSDTQSLADVVLYTMVYKVIVNMSHQDKEKHMHISRWFDNIQQNPKLRQNNDLVHFCQTPLYL